MNQVQFTSQLSFKEYIKASFYTTYHQPSIIILTVFGVFMLFSALPIYTAFDGKFRNTGLWAVVFGLYFSVLIPALIYFKGKKAFNAKNRFTERIDWTVDYEWIAMKGESFEAKMTWDKLFKVVETKELFLIYQNKATAHIVSKRQMSREQVQGFRSLVSGLLGMKHKLRTD